MLKQPTYGFARRVDDTATRPMSILQNRPDYTVRADERQSRAADTRSG
jgi:hypothetical protein